MVWEPEQWKENIRNSEKKVLLCHDCVCGTKFWVFCGLKPTDCGDWFPDHWVFGLVFHDWSCAWVFGLWKPKC